MQCKFYLLCGILYNLQRLYNTKIYIKLFKNHWIGNIAAGDCVQIVYKESNMRRKLLK
jgi:hypothetical protein